MRIISGTLKGRKLCSWKKGIPLRPMTDRVKESVFNVLSPYFFEGCLFLDLFSGTGNLALEALSRGAESAHAVEKNPLCIKLIKKNAQMLKDPKKLIVHKKDVFSFLKQTGDKSQWKRNQKIKPFDIITADPPFAIQGGENIMLALKNSCFSAKGTVVLIETGQNENLRNKYSDFYLFSKKTFNDKKVWFYEFQ